MICIIRSMHLPFQRWQKKWFRLMDNGDLHYYDSPDKVGYCIHPFTVHEEGNIYLHLRYCSILTFRSQVTLFSMLMAIKPNKLMASSLLYKYLFHLILNHNHGCPFISRNAVCIHIIIHRKMCVYFHHSML